MVGPYFGNAITIEETLGIFWEIWKYMFWSLRTANWIIFLVTDMGTSNLETLSKTQQPKVYGVGEFVMVLFCYGLKQKQNKYSFCFGDQDPIGV